MKNISNSYLEWLLSTDVESCYTCDLITIVLPSGLTMYITDGQVPISYGGNLYSPSLWGWWQVSSTQVSIGSMNATCNVNVYADETIIMPTWNDTMMHAIQAGLFDGAEFTAVTFSMDVYGDVSLGGSIRYSGQITEMKPVGGNQAQGVIKPYTFTMNQPMPRQILQPGCSWIFGGTGCKFNKSTVTFSFTVGAGTTAVDIAPATAPTQAGGYFTQGVIKMTSGRNSGLAGMIQMHSGGKFRLAAAFIFPIAIGDTFTATAGCDHTYATCQTKFDNAINYGGMPFIPNRETAL